MSTTQQHAWDFSQIQQDLISTDSLKQVNAATKTFDEWYHVAKLYVQGIVSKDDMLRCSSDFLYTATISNYPGKLFDIDMDSYVLSKLQNILCDFFNILQTKQKFQILCKEQKFSSICNWIVQYMITPFYQSILNDRINSENRCEYIKTLTGLLNLGIFLNENYPDIYSSSPFSFDPAPLTTLVVNPQEDSHLRDNGLLLLYSIHIIFRAQTLLAVCNTVRDRYIFTWLWTTDIFNQPSVLIALKMRIKFLAARDKHILIELLHSIHDALPNIYKEMTISSITQLLSIVSLCELKNDIDSDSVTEYTSTYIALFQLFLNYFPDCDLLYDYLSTNPSLSITMYTSILNQNIDFLSNQSLYNYILPYVTQKLLLFKTGERSSDDNEQCLIDFIRDISVTYLEKEGKCRDIIITKLLFLDCISCIRLGYIETERFPEICSKLLKLEYTASEMNTEEQSLSWLRTLFIDQQYDTLRTRHALKDIISLCVYYHLGGISGQENETILETGNNSNIEYNDPFVLLLFNVFTTIGHRDVFFIWNDLLLENKYILSNNNAANHFYEKQLLTTVNEYIKNISKEQDIVINTYESIFCLSHSLSSVISPSLTFLLFEVVLRTTYISSQFLPDKILCDDDLLTYILTRFPRTDTVSTDIYYTRNDIIDICITICNEQTRQQLAYLFPTRFIKDISTIVRKTALACVAQYPSLIMQNAQLIYEGILLGVQDEDKHIGLGEFDLILSSSMSIYHLCLLKPEEYASNLIEVLLKGIKLSEENDTQNLPSSILVNCLNDIAVNMPNKYIYSIVSSFNRSQVEQLFEYSYMWNQYYTQYKSELSSSTTTHIVSEYEAGLSVINNYMNTEQYMEALRSCISLKNKITDLNQISSLCTLLITLLQKVAEHCLPKKDVYSKYVIPATRTISDINYWLSIVTELQTLCPTESETNLHISELYYNLISMYNSLTTPVINSNTTMNTLNPDSSSNIITCSTSNNTNNMTNTNDAPKNTNIFPNIVPCSSYDSNIIQSSLFQKLNNQLNSQ